MGLIAEALGSLGFSCTILLLVPLVAGALACGQRSATLAVATVAATIAAAARFSGWFPAPPTGAGRVVVGLVLGAVFAAAVVVVIGRRAPLTGWGGWGLAVASGVGSAWFWIPCVGSHFADIITGLGSPGAILRLLLFNLTLAAPALVLLALIDLADGAVVQDRLGRVRPGIAAGAAGVGVALAALIVIDRYAELARFGT